jgi:phospholipid/cholesterol/gamma-HCH transport system substrate-binding protein
MALFRRRKDPRSPGMTPLRAGIIGAIVLVVVVFFGFTRFNPFSSPYELDAVFKTANNIQPNSPVRIAGVNVGAVESVEGLPGGGAKVKMTLQNDALPIHRDAQLKIRPRIFLEGNYFVDIQPGTPESPKVKSGYTVPVNQTATPVQLDQVLASLQADTRASLQTLLKEYAERGLGNGGAQAYNQGLNYAPGAEQYSSIANDATLGEHPHDLSNLLRGQQRLFRSLSSNPQTLQDLITQLNVTFQAFASEDVPLAQTVPALRDTLRIGVPALRSLDSALPSLRTFARTALPGTLSSGPTIDASLPEVTQLRLLIRPQELEGLVRDLRPTIPALAKLNHDTIALLAENRALSACQNNVLLPFSKTPIPNPDFPSLNNRPFYKLAPQSLTGLAGESRVSDANTPMFHLQVQSGPTVVIMKNTGRKIFAAAPAPPRGSRPIKPDHTPVFRPGAPCEVQQVPDLNAPGGPPLASVTEPGSGLLPSLPANAGLMARATQQLNEVHDFLARQRAHQPTVDPLSVTQPEYVKQMRQLGLGVTAQGKTYQLPQGAGK